MKIRIFGLYLIFCKCIYSLKIDTGSLLKFGDFIMKQTGLSEFYDKATLSKSMKTNIALYNLKDVPFVTNKRVQYSLRQAFQNEYGGMNVVVSPPGSGKTTYIRQLANEHIRNGGAVRIFGSELNNMNDFYNSFGGSDRRLDLFNMLPNRSVIILDQLEHLKPFPLEMENLLLHLACESRRTAECNIIVSLSDPVLANKVLRLNGLDKIKQCGKVCDFQWQNEEIEEFIEKGFNSWSEKQKQEVKKLGLIAQSPIFMHALYTTYHKTGLSEDLLTLQRSAHMFEEDWAKFKEDGL